MATAGVAAAQPVYEIGYQFNGGDEVVRVENEPFVVEVASDLVAIPDVQELSIGFPFATTRRQGLVAPIGQIRRSRDPLPELTSIGRASVTFTDLMFTSAQSDPIVVDLVIMYGLNQIFITAGTVSDGVVSETRLTAELAGDERVGTSTLTLRGTRPPELVRTGFLEDLPADRHPILEGISVPVNTPVTLHFEVQRSMYVPAGGDFIDFRLRAPDDARPAPGLPIGRPVFILPAGVTVDSEQAGIRDNRFIVCAADLDGDAQLTIFDFLAFQNLFDAGDLLADFDGDGDLTLFDFLAFQNQFDAGC